MEEGATKRDDSFPLQTTNCPQAHLGRLFSGSYAWFQPPGSASAARRPRSQPLPIRCRLHARDSSGPAHTTTTDDYAPPTQRGFSPFSAGQPAAALVATAGGSAGAHAAGRPIRRRSGLSIHAPTPCSRLCAAAAAATPQGALLSEASRRGGALHAVAAASHSESHPDRTGKQPQEADHARQGLVVQSNTRGLAVPRAPGGAMPRRAAAAPTSESAGPPPAWTGRRLPGPGRHALAGSPIS